MKEAESQGDLIKMTYLCEISRTYGEASERNVESKGDRRTLAGRGGTDIKPIPPLNFTHFSLTQVNDFFLRGDNLLVTVWG